jgi:hypothetical protein
VGTALGLGVAHREQVALGLPVLPELEGGGGDPLRDVVEVPDDLVAADRGDHGDPGDREDAQDDEEREMLRGRGWWRGRSGHRGGGGLASRYHNTASRIVLMIAATPLASSIGLTWKETPSRATLALVAGADTR